MQHTGKVYAAENGVSKSTALLRDSLYTCHIAAYMQASGSSLKPAVVR